MEWTFAPILPFQVPVVDSIHPLLSLSASGVRTQGPSPSLNADFLAIVEVAFAYVH
jgi:hypothetical protein